MHVDGQIELFGALVDRPEALVVKEHAVGEAVQHGALEAELCGAIESSAAASGTAVEAGESGEARRIGFDHGGEAIVDAAGEIGGGRCGKLLRRRRAVREHLDVDAGFVHVLDAQRAEIVQPVDCRPGRSPGVRRGWPGQARP